MVCKLCKRKFHLPLNLFNGQAVCPHCKNQLVAVSALEITKENEEQFALSKIALLRYLSPKSWKVSNMNVAGVNLLEKAMEYCDVAAKSGNPKAIFQMAYLLEYFQTENKNQVESIRLAFGYYSALCYNELTSVRREDGAKEFSSQEFLDLKISAATNLLRICSTYAALLKSSGGYYDYKMNKERLSALYKGVKFPENQALNTFNKVNTVYNTLMASRSRTKAPLFGVFMLSVGQMQELFSIKDKACKKLISKSPDLLYYMPCDKNGRVQEMDRYFSRIASVEIADRVLEEQRARGYMYLYFFNTSGKHPYLNIKQMQTVKAELERDDQALLQSLVSYISSDMMVFFDDDIERYKIRNSAHGAVEKLIDCVREE